MVTPFDYAGYVDLDVAVALARHLVANGSDGIVLAGSTGEGSALSDDEKLSLFAAVAEAVTVPVIAGTTDANTAHSISLTAAASATGVSGILATTPAYVRPSQKGIALHFAAIAAATTLPVMLYDIPARTGRKIMSETTIAVARESANVLGLKDASGDLDGARHVKQTLGDGFDLFAGDDSLLLEFLTIGATGIVGVATHWAGVEFANAIRAFRAGQHEVAQQIVEQLRSSCAFESTERFPNPLPAKAVMSQQGFAVGDCRLPLGPVEQELRTLAQGVLQEVLDRRG